MTDYYLTTPLSRFHTAVGATFASFTTKQDVSPQPMPIMPATLARAGTKLWIKANGEFSTTGTPNITLGLFIGTLANPSVITTDIALSSVIATGSGAAAWPWEMEWQGTFTSDLGSNNVTGSGELKLGTALTTWTSTPIPVTAALRTFTWDTTVAKAIGVSATYSASSASNTVKVNNLIALLQN